MQLIQSWKSSLKFFAPTNIKLFGLLALNTTVKTVSVWFRLFWPLFIVSIVADLLPIPLIGLFAKFLLFMTLFLSVRPSVRKKNYFYFSRYKWHALIIGVLFMLKTLGFQWMSGLNSQVADLLVLSWIFPTSLVSIFVTPFMLFYLDSHGSFADFFWSAWRSIKMVFFGLPFFLIIVGAFSAVFYVLLLVAFRGFLPFSLFVRSLPAGLLGLFGLSLVKHLLFILSVPAVAVYANFYTKRLHDQFNLYFRA